MKRAFTQIIAVAILAMASSAFAFSHSATGDGNHPAQVGSTTTAPPTETSSTTSASSSETPAPSQKGEVSFTQIMDEVGALTNQEGQTLAQQQTSEIDAVKLQAQDTLNQAMDMMQGANMMMTMATVGVALSVATTGMSASGIGEASKEGDQAELSAESQSELSIEAQESKLFQIQWDLHK